MNKKITIAVIIIILVAAIGGAAYMLLPNADTKDDAVEKSDTNTTLYNASGNKNTNKNSNKNSNKNTNVTKNDNTNTTSGTDTTNSNTNTNTTTNANKNTNTTTETAASTTYKNDKYGFSVKLPKGTEFLSDKEELGFYPFGLTDSKDEEGYEGEWFVSIYSSKKATDLIPELSKSAKDRKEKKEDITVGSLKGTKVTVTSGETAVQTTAIYLEKNGKTFEIMDGGAADKDFEAFYKSFAF